MSKERYYINLDDAWDIFYNEGSLMFPTYITSADTLEAAKLVKDALESFEFTIEDYL